MHQRIQIVAHSSSPMLGTLPEILIENNVTYDVLSWRQLEAQSEYTGTILLGGTQSLLGVTDEGFTSYRHEIENILKLRGKVFGICLGAQILAEIYGVKVFKPSQDYLEIGYTSLLQSNEHCRPNWRGSHFNWHYDCIEDNTNALSVSTTNSDGIVQSFSISSFCAGVQFHPETNSKTLDKMYELGKSRFEDSRVKPIHWQRQQLMNNHQENRRQLTQALKDLKIIF